MMNEKSNDEKTFKNIEFELNRYSIYLKKLVKDLKTKNHPLDKKYHTMPELRWFQYRKWYTVIHNDKKIYDSIDWDRFIYLVSRDLQQTNFFKKMNKIINDISKNKDQYLFQHWIEKFLFVHFYDEQDSLFERKNLVRHFLNAIKDEPPTVATSSFLSGIIIEQNQIKINNNLIIRKAKKDDFILPLEMGSSHDYEDTVERSFCILEYTYKQHDKHIHSFEHLDKIKIILLLFKLSSPTCTGTLEKSSEIDFFRHGKRRSGFYPKRGIVYYAKIKNSEIESLIKFYKIMNKRLTRSMVNYYFERTESDIALSRFMKGVEWIHHVDSSVSYAVMAIEALLIKSEGDQKLRFALKSSKLLSLMGLDMKQVYENMLLAYAVRSNYVHGDKMNQPTSNKITKKFKHKEKFAFTIMDYARLIISIFILLNKSKEFLYKILEDTQFENDDKNIKNLIKPYLQCFPTKKHNPQFRQYATHSIEYLTE